MRMACTFLIAASLAAPAFADDKPASKHREAVEEATRAERHEDDGGLGALFHASPERVRARLGDPDVSRAEGKGGFWTYRLPHCALFLFFHEGPKGMRVTGASTGPRKRGEPSPSVPVCLASAVQLPVPEN
jgi:hypothetical protein